MSQPNQRRELKFISSPAYSKVVLIYNKLLLATNYLLLAGRYQQKHCKSSVPDAIRLRLLRTAVYRPARSQDCGANHFPDRINICSRIFMPELSTHWKRFFCLSNSPKAAND
jgi:hypothetical protein